MISGLIILWQGSIANIPSGFVLCDGNNGTPDLRNKFIVGAGDTYAVDAAGGNLTHTHSFTGDGHLHTLGGGTEVETGFGRNDQTSSNPATGTSDAESSLPPYHSLAYIMKT